ncbi:ArnT family glycosyltransferase [Acidobacteriota bacterium]
MGGKRHVSLVVVLLLLSFFIRAAPVWMKPEKIRNGMGPFGDTPVYVQIAGNILDGKGFSQSPEGDKPAVLRTPIYPLFLVLFQWTGSRALDITRTIQCLIDTGTVLLVFLSARMLARGRWNHVNALAAALLGATCPYLFTYARYLLSETLTVFFVTLALTLTLWAVRSRYRGLWVLAGAAFGLSGLARPDKGWVIIFLIPALILVYRGKIRKALPDLILMIAGFACCLAPWTIRNAVHFGRFIPYGAGNIGFNLYIGTWEDSSRWMASGWDFPRDTGPPGEREEVEEILSFLKVSHVLSGGSEMFEPDKRLLAISMKRIAGAPADYSRLCLARIPRLWWFDPYDKYLYPDPPGIYFAVYFVLALIGTAVLWKHSDRLFLIPWTLLIYITVVHIPLHVEARFSLAGLPALFLLASGILSSDRKIPD